MRRSFLFSLLVATAAASPTAPHPLAYRADADTAVVNLGLTKGKPQHLASGFIYGIPDTPNQVADHWYTDMGFNYARVGGAQLGAPNRGWIWGLQEYQGRLKSTLSNYWTARKYGASVILLPHDIWGTDNANSSTHWPGDNGDWKDWDAFTRRLMADMKSNGALKGLVWDIWNEPDIGVFWTRSRQQWIDLYIRTHKIIRGDPDYNAVQISGPSLAFRPLSDNVWWTSWLSQIKGNSTIPDQYSYHLEGETAALDNDLQTTNATFKALLATYGLPDRQININEYANPQEQVPTATAWYISRLERYDAIGLRGNWLGGTGLHDLFANTLTKQSDPLNYYATDYVPAPDFQVYKYYATNMTGLRAGTTGSGDRKLDVYSTIGSDKVRILCGSLLVTGTWYIRVDGLSHVGLPTAGSLTIQTWGFDGASVWDIAQAPSDRYKYTHTYTGDSLTFPIFQTDTHTAWAFEFDVVK